MAAFSLCATTAFLAPVDASGEVVYRSGEGWSTQSPDADPAVASANEELARAEAYEAEGNLARAADAYRTIVRRYPDAVYVAKAQLKLAKLLEADGDYETAFRAYGDYIKKYPRGQEFNEAVDGQFRIAKVFLEGERRRLFGIKTFPSMERTQEMFEEVLKSAPYSRVAPPSQFYIGQALEKQGKTTEALEAYQKVLANYPNDPIAADAQYQIGYVWFTQSKQGSYDPKARERAREAFEDFIARYPDSEKVPQARENMSSLGSARAENLLGVAQFYDKQKQYKAAVIYYNDVIKNQPGSPESEVARTRISELVDLVGEDALRAGPEKAETGARASQRRRIQSQVDTAARSDYVGPPVAVADETPRPRPRLRTSPEDVSPIPAVEPDLPTP